MDVKYISVYPLTLFVGTVGGIFSIMFAFNYGMNILILKMMLQKDLVEYIGNQQ